MTGVDAALLAWMVVVGMDLVSVGQFMLSRPLVAGLVAGAIVGDPVAGGTVGMVFELFALDVMPIGAVRYPDYGMGAVVAAVVVAGAPFELVVGVGVLAGLVVAVAGEIGSHLVRRANGAATAMVADRIAEHGASAVTRLHLAGLARDGIRAVTVGAAGLVLARSVRAWFGIDAQTALLLALVMVGCALGTAAAGSFRVSGTREHGGWLVAGLLVGVGIALL